jgi:hypothetical protein
MITILSRAYYVHKKVKIVDFSFKFNNDVSFSWFQSKFVDTSQPYLHCAAAKLLVLVSYQLEVSKLRIIIKLGIKHTSGNEYYLQALRQVQESEGDKLQMVTGNNCTLSYVVQYSFACTVCSSLF